MGKSNDLPKWDHYFPLLCDVEYLSYEAAWKYDKAHDVFEKCAAEHVNTDEAKMKLYGEGLSKDDFTSHLREMILPPYKAAQNLGFGEWRA